jgi:O-antigen/teichoic acid export membrane protein
MVNLAILVVSSKQLGSDMSGQVSLLILNIAIIQIVNEVYTGYTLVYFIPKYNLKKIYGYGVLWTICCTVLCALLYLFMDSDAKEYWIHVIILSFIIIMHSFHMVILLAKEKIKQYNFLNFLQPTLLLAVLLIAFFVVGLKTTTSYVIALYVSFSISILISLLLLGSVFKNQNSALPTYDAAHIFKNGFYNQVANLCHILSNRFNFYLLGNTILVGIYARSSTLIESIWIISGSVSPIILSHIANSNNTKNDAKITLLLAKICFVLSAFCVVVLYFIPREFFVFLLGEDFIHVKTVMMYLSPGIIVISFATIISHYFSGLGKQKILLAANGFGLLATLCTSHYLVSHYQLLGACYATVISYFVAASILTIVFMKENKFNLVELLKLKPDFSLLKKE